ncbi:MAG: ABC transporter ATP-binding protein, partial [bacterium]
MTEPMTANTALLEGVGLVKRYGELVVLDGVGFRLAAGDAVGVVGPNLACKTTLMIVLAGSVAPIAGT